MLIYHNYISACFGNLYRVNLFSKYASTCIHPLLGGKNMSVFSRHYRSARCMSRCTHTAPEAQRQTVKTPQLPKTVSSQQTRKQFTSIPGPPRIPIIGSLLPYKLGLKNTNYYHEYLREMYETYGPIVREDQGSTTIIHVFDPVDIAAVYWSTTTPHVPPLLQTAKDYKQTNNMRPGLGNTNGLEWELLRKAVNKVALNPKAARKHIHKQDVAARDAVQLLDQEMLREDGTVPHIENLIDRWVTESMGVVVTGMNNGFLMKGKQSQFFPLRMAELNRRIFELSAHLKLSSGLYKSFRSTKARQLKAAEDEFYSIAHILCEEIVTLMMAHKRDGTDQQDTSILWNMVQDGLLDAEDMASIAMSLITDAYSTTAPTMLGALHCLAMAPVVQQEIYEEVLRECPSHQPAHTNTFNTTTTLNAFLKEVHRLYPIGDSVQRLLTQDMVLSGYHLPPGTRVDLNQYIWQRDPTVVSDPDSVQPGRWNSGRSRSKEAGQDKINNVLFTPFSTGVRLCVGSRLATQDLSCLVARVVEQFEVSLSEPKSPRQVYRVLLRPETPIPLVFRRRHEQATQQ